MNEAVDFKIVEAPAKPMSMNPKKFGMWLFIASVMMLFMSLTSAYIVRQAEGNWLYFELPTLFMISCGVIIVSSFSMQLAYRAAKKDKYDKIKTYVAITTVLGFTFLVLQYLGWKDMVSNSIYLVGNPSGSFIYILTGLHGLHIVSAIVYLLIVLNSASKLKISSGNMTQMEMCTTYWHFLGLLWLYLFVFLTLLR